jgi:hypothetical protein
MSNYDRSCVYSISTVDVTAPCFTDDIIQAMDLAVPGLSLDSQNSLTLSSHTVTWYLETELILQAIQK